MLLFVWLFYLFLACSLVFLDVDDVNARCCGALEIYLFIIEMMSVHCVDVTEGICSDLSDVTRYFSHSSVGSELDDDLHKDHRCKLLALKSYDLLKARR